MTRDAGINTHEPLGRIIGYIALIAWTLAVLLPFGWSIMASFKTEWELRTDPFGLPRSWQGSPDDALASPAPANDPAFRRIGPVDNYRLALDEMHFARYFRNSLAVVGVSLILILIVATPASYALARLSLPGSRFLLIYLLTGLMIPAQLILVPLFFQYSAWSDGLTAVAAPSLRVMGCEHATISLHDSHLGLILIYVATALPFTVFVLTSFFRTLPNELYEAGIIDGCTEWQAFVRVMLPLARTGLITVTILNFIGLWNEYLFALVFVHDDALRTLPLGLADLSIQANYRRAGQADAGVLFAGLVIVMVPTLVVYLLLQKYLIKGVTVGAVKG
jgi:ABC-type glycerol-3-phosphate transport system permease component